MSVNGKYASGILLTFVLLASAMLYSFPFLNTVTGTAGLTSEKFLYSRMMLWFVAILVFLYSHFIEKHRFLLWKEKPYSVLFYTGAVISLYFICLFGGVFVNVLVKISTHEKTSGQLVRLALIFKGNYPLIILTCLTAGVVEELLMRGYMQPRMEKIYRNPYVGIIIPAVLFGILHSTYGTFGQVLVPFFIGVVFAVFYKRYSNIKILMACHFMYDFVSLVTMNFINIKHLSAL
ncbi:CPBP family intramembrane glutamic endopeptidase [Chryseobacterium gregarium]|uniref:CPBP family intramembrane glutamic endopeptidase n=1 Tax=Chryseobacterium gregarium TaxID=456299 RepID=UPI000428271C|nr:type II CAAX endopeptidase family protein [Chryseobacterium gregarium]